MDTQNHLGIYISRKRAITVCLSSDRSKILDYFTVSTDDKQSTQISPKDSLQSEDITALADLIAKGCSERNLAFSEVSVALDCVLFMQHSVHSQFADLKQISSTIRFDTEEALAADASEYAIAFKVVSKDQTGANLSVFTTEKKILSDIITALQNNNIDPVTIEPDANCLSRVVFNTLSDQNNEETKSLFVFLSNNCGYFVTPISLKPHKISIERTFLIDSAQNITDLLTKEIPLTTAVLNPFQSIGNMKLFDSTDSADCNQLNNILATEAIPIDSIQPEIISSAGKADVDSVDLLIAYGAALGLAEKTQIVNFRDDFMPFMGKRRRLEKTVKILSISLTIIFIALGIYFQMHLINKNKPLKKLRSKFSDDYSVAMMNKTLPANFEKALKNLNKEKKRIESAKSGQISVTGEKTVSAKLTLILEALNSVAKQTNLKIEKISITGKSININGDTSNRTNTLKLLNAIKSKFVLQQQRLGPKEGRDTFSITIVPK